MTRKQFSNTGHSRLGSSLNDAVPRLLYNLAAPIVLQPSASPSANPVAWAGPVDGDWNTGAFWTGGAAPTSGSNAEIAVQGTYTVTITASAAAACVTLDDGGATLAVNQQLAISGTLAVEAGTLVLGSAGVLFGGTLLADAGGTLVLDNGGSLLDVDLQGTVTLDTDDGSVFLGNGLAAGSAATIDVAGASEFLEFNDTATLAGANILFEPVDGNAIDQIFLDTPTDSGNSTFTISSGTTITAEQNTYITGNNFNPSFLDIAVVNDGVINVAGSQVAFDVGAQMAAFDNAGTMAVSAGAIVFLSADLCENTGTITVTGANSALYYDNAGEYETVPPWTNAGVLSAQDGGTIYLEGNSSVAEFDTISNAGGTINIAGSIDGPGTITLPTKTGDTNALVLSGTIANATIVDPDGILGLQGNAFLLGDHVQGVINIASQDNPNGYSQLGVDNTLFAGAGGIGLGTINMTGPDSNFNPQGTLNNAVLSMSGLANLSFGEFGSAPVTLTFGSTFQVVSLGNANISDGGSDTLINRGQMLANGADDRLQYQCYGEPTNPSTNRVANRGTILAGNTGLISFGSNGYSNFTFSNSGRLHAGSFGTLEVSYAVSVINSGIISASGGGTVDIVATDLSNTGTIMAEGAATAINLETSVDAINGDTGTINNHGQVDVAEGATVEISGSFEQSGLVSVTGAGSTLLTDRMTVGDESTRGTLTVGHGSKIGSAALIDADGTISIKDGTIDVSGRLVVDAGSVMTGAGVVVASSIVDLGVVGVSNGTLSCLGPVAGTGTLDMSGGAELFLKNTEAAGIGLVFGSGGGTLSANSSASLMGTTTNWAVGDIIDLRHSVAVADSFLNGTLSLLGPQGQVVGTLLFAGALTNPDFVLMRTPGGGVSISH